MTTVSEPDFYDVLGIGRDANHAEIRDAFRARARRLHPDVSPDSDAEDRFAELSRAYAILSKPTSRILYDRVGYRGRGNGGFEPAGNITESAGTLFDVAEVEVDAYDAEHGATRRIAVTTVGICSRCTGTGAEPGFEVFDCSACDGSGRLRKSSEVGTARLLQIDACGDCGGTGRIVEESCGECEGSGRAHVERSLEVLIPPGTTDGTLVRAEGGPEDGDVYLALRVVPQRDERLVRYAAITALVLALALFVVLAVAPETLT